MALSKFITGADELSKTFDALAVETRTKLAKKAVDDVGKLMVAAMRYLVPVRHGALRQALGQKTLGYEKNATAVSIAGVQRKLKFSTPDGIAAPSKYLHLVEFGHVGRDGKFHSPTRPFIRPAIETVGATSGDVMSRSLSSGIEKLVARYQKKVAKL